ncbi:MAG: hypothetical protein ACM3ZF_00060, partial [Mycobacterium leprae]
MGLPGARRPVELQAALEVLTPGQQRGAVPPDPDDLPLDRLQHAGGQHERGPVQPRAAVEAQHRLAGVEHLPAEGQDLAAEHVVLEGELPNAGGDRARGARLGADHLDRDALVHAVPLRAAQQQRRAALGAARGVGVADEVQRAGDARAHRAVRAGRDVHPGHLPRTRRPRLVLTR